MSWAMDALGLPEDADARAVKRAYAARLKTTRPDDDPVAFQQLHETYQAALAWCADLAQDDDSASARHETLVAPTSLRRITTMTTPATAQRRLAEQIEDATLEAELRDWNARFDADTLATTILEAACTMRSSGFGAWLRAIPELWSLELRPRVGDAVLLQLASASWRLADAPLAILAVCFDQDDEIDFHEAALAARLCGIAAHASADYLTHCLQQWARAWDADTHRLVGTLALRRLHAQRTMLRADAIVLLMQAFGWTERGDGAVAWLCRTRDEMRRHDALTQRHDALLPHGSNEALARCLQQAGWTMVTPEQAGQLRAQLMHGRSLRQSFAAAMRPLQPTSMARFCNIVRTWCPDRLPASIDPRQLRFWTQIGNPQRPHLRQLALAVARGAVVAAALMLPFAAVAWLGWQRDIAWSVQAIAGALGVWIGLTLLQMAARWQMRTDVTPKSRHVVQQAALPLAGIASFTLLRDAGPWFHVSGAALLYIAVARWAGRFGPEARGWFIAVMVMSVPVSLLPLFAISPLIPWPITQALFWLAPIALDGQPTKHH